MPVLRHKESWAEERKAPSAEEWRKIQEGEGEAAPRARTSKQVASEGAPEPEAKPQTVTTILRRRPGS